MTKFQKQIARAIKALKTAGEGALAAELRAVVFKYPHRKKEAMPSKEEFAGRFRALMSEACVEYMRSLDVSTENIRSKFPVDQVLKRSGITQKLAEMANDAIEAVVEEEQEEHQEQMAD